MREFLTQFVIILSQLLIFAILARVVLSWFRAPVSGPFMRIIVQSTEPVLAPFRRLIPPIGGVFDISPIVAYFAIELIRDLILKFIL